MSGRPEGTSWWFRRLLEAEGYLELGLLDEAARVLGSLSVEDRARPEVLGFALGLHMMTKDWEKAEVLAAHLVEQDPSNPMWWVNLAYSVRRARSLEDAEKILLRAVKLHPGDLTIRYNLACYACVDGRISLAKERFLEVSRFHREVFEMGLSDEDLLPLREWIAELMTG